MTTTVLQASSTQELAERDCWALLTQSVVGRLAVVRRDGRPDIFPVNHVVDLGTVVIRTSAGTKLAGANGRPVAFEVDGYDLEAGAAWSVVVHGTARRELSTEPTLGLDPRTMPLLPWQDGVKPWLLRIEADGPDAVSGRRIMVTGGSRGAGA